MGRVLSLFAALLFVAGCQPVGVVWLPDSSGFVLSVLDPGRATYVVAHYDLTKRSGRIIRDQTATVWPAVSPDGTRVATADLEQGTADRPDTLRVVISDLDGREVDRSSRLPLGEGDAKRERSELFALAGVLWGPDDRVLVGFVCAGPCPYGTAIYSLRRKAWRLLPNVLPWPAAEVSPVLPHGRGILARREVTAGRRGEAAASHSEPVLVAWDGAVRPVRAPDGAAVELPSISDGPALSSRGRREGDVLQLPWKQELVRLDAANATWTAEPATPIPTQPAAPPDRPPMLASYTFPRTGLRVVCRPTAVSRPRRSSLPFLSRDKVTWFQRYDVMNPAGERLFTIDDDDDRDVRSLFGPSEPTAIFFPSPDGTRLAIRCRAPFDGSDTVTVIDDAGKFLAGFECKSLLPEP